MLPHLTPTQRCLLHTLSDGLPHTRRELHRCLPDDLGALSNIKVHLSAMRKLLRPRGEDILCVLHNRTICYCLVRRYTVPGEGAAQI